MAIVDLVPLAALLLLVLRVFQPWSRPPAGPVIHHEPLSLLGRLRMFGPPAVALLAATVVGWWVGPVSPVALIVVTVGLVLLLATPVRYTLTPHGIALGRTPLRRWTEFAGVARQRWGVRLQGVGGNRGMAVWLSGGRDDDAFVLLLRQLVRGSYQGWLLPASHVAGEETDAALPLGRAPLPTA